MRTYRGTCATCGQTRTRQLGWHVTPYRNTCAGAFEVASVTERGQTLFTTAGKPVLLTDGQVER